jgi:23S rRNA (adenine2503-C2)-methyltransferase
MGMGEPLLNLPAVIPAVRYLQDTLGISGRNITISTVGVPNALRKLAEAQLTATLAVSIHAPNQVGHPHLYQPVCRSSSHACA